MRRVFARGGEAFSQLRSASQLTNTRTKGPSHFFHALMHDCNSASKLIRTSSPKQSSRVTESPTANIPLQERFRKAIYINAPDQTVNKK